MPVFNGGRFLDEAIHSILTQTLDDLELIVIDDGSTDNTPEIIEQHRRKDARVRTLSQTNHGLIATLNRGLALTQGAYVARMDQDDISLPKRLATQVMFMETHHDVGVCGTWIETFDGDSRHVVRLPTDDTAIRSWLLFESVLPHPSVMMRREAFSKMKMSYATTYVHAEDYDLWVRASRCMALANVGEVLLRYRIHPEQIVRKYESEKLASARQVRKNQLEYLGISPRQEELNLHQALSTWQFESTVDFLNATEAWLARLLSANEKTKRYDHGALARVLGTRWAAVCAGATQLGLRTARTFLGSPLSAETGQSWKDVVKLLIKCGIRQRQHA
jgi:glycosyltransferase involved in cell wall biosynthesis